MSISWPVCSSDFPYSFYNRKVPTPYHHFDGLLVLIVHFGLQVLIDGFAEEIESTGGQKIVALHVAPNLSRCHKILYRVNSVRSSLGSLQKISRTRGLEYVYLLWRIRKKFDLGC